MQNRALSVVGLRVWNGLPQELCLLPRLCRDKFWGHLKACLFVCTGVGSTAKYFEGSLYKFLNEWMSICLFLLIYHHVSLRVFLVYVCKHIYKCICVWICVMRILKFLQRPQQLSRGNQRMCVYC